MNQAALVSQDSWHRKECRGHCWDGDLPWPPKDECERNDGEDDSHEEQYHDSVAQLGHTGLRPGFNSHGCEKKEVQKIQGEKWDEDLGGCGRLQSD